MLNRSILVWLAIVALGLPSLVSADETEDKAKAKAAYKEALVHYRTNELDKALAEFKESYHLYQTPETLFNIAQTQRLLRDYKNAIYSYRMFLSTSKSEEVDRKVVEDRIADCQRLLEEQQKAAAAPPQGNELPIKTTAVQQPQPAAPVVIERVDRRPRRALLIAGITLGVFGVAAIGAAGGFYAVAKDAAQKLAHPANGVFSATQEDRRNTFQSLDITAFVVGGVAAAAGVTCLGLAVGGRRVVVSPVASATNVGLSAVGSF